MRKSILLLSLSLLLSATTQAQERRATVISTAPLFGATGTVVSIRGSGFAQPGEVWASKSSTEQPPGWVSFNGTAGEVVFWSADLISVRVPAGASTGPLRVMLVDARAPLNAGDFEVYYSSGEAEETRNAVQNTGAGPDRFARPPSRGRLEDQPGIRDEWRSDFYPANPWFSGLSPGERTFLGEQGPAATFIFGNPFSLGRNRGFSGGGFRGGFFAGPRFDDRLGFGNFGFQRPFFFNFSNHGRARGRAFPFFFFWR